MPGMSKPKIIYSAPCDGWCKIYEPIDSEKGYHHDHKGYDICRHFRKPECPHADWLERWIKQLEKWDNERNNDNR